MSFFGRGRRTRTPLPYNVRRWERCRVAGDDWDVIVVGGWYRSVVAVYHHWSRRFYFCFGIPPLADVQGGRAGVWRAVMSFIEKSRPVKSGPAAFVQARCPWLAKQCPAVHEYMTVGELPGGEVRQLSTLTVFVEGGLWKACLSEKDAEVNLFASGADLESLLDNLEERLTASHVDWRRKGGVNGRPSQKRS
jgi:hypothetical protein